MQAAVRNGIMPILCVGETLEERLAGETNQILHNQITAGLMHLTTKEVSASVIAYEPVWAIGKNAERAATNEEIVESVDFIRFYLENHFGRGSGDVKVVYGGSVDEKNIKEILNIKSIDGILAGRASADTDKWEKLLRNSK
jgi:triosephosphate isomerase